MRSQNERRRRKRERERERERKKSHTDLGEWVQGDLIGRGGFGSVYRAYSINKPSLKVAQVSDSDSGTNNLPALLAENILLVKSPLGDVFIAKIADFGLAKSDENKHSCQGTRMYMPPETLSSSIQGKPSDIWALGCTVLEMLTGELLPRNWVSDPVISSHLSEDAKDCLAKCLHVNGSKKFTAERLLTHSFLMSKETVQRISP